MPIARVHRLRIWRLTLLAGLVSCAACRANVLDMSFPSLEWAVEASDLVVRGTVRPGMQREFKDSNGAMMREVTLDVSEAIKGDAAAPPQLKFITSADRLAGTEKTWADVLVFLNRSLGAVRANAGSEQVESWDAYRWLAFDLGQERAMIWSMDGRELAGEKLVEAARQAAQYARERAGPCTRYVLPRSLPPDPPPAPPPPPGESILGSNLRQIGMARLYGLQVPLDARLEALAKRWLGHESSLVRCDAVRVLGEFRSEQSVALLRRLLQDEQFYADEKNEWSPRLDQRASKFYPVRRAALDQLLRWNAINRADATVYVPLMQYQPVRWWGWAIALGLVILMTAWPTTWGSGRIGGRAVMFCLGLILLLAWVAWQTRATSRTASYAAAGADWEINWTRGAVWVLRVQDDAPPHGWMVRSYAPRDGGPVAWFYPLLWPAQAASGAGFYAAQGITRGASGFAYRLIIVPYWMLMALLLIWPAARWVELGRRAVRRRRRIRQNRCGGCGYDLRASVGRGRCPECGAEIPQRAM